jgi:hypothetical protein
MHAFVGVTNDFQKRVHIPSFPVLYVSVSEMTNDRCHYAFIDLSCFVFGERSSINSSCLSGEDGPMAIVMCYILCVRFAYVVPVPGTDIRANDRYSPPWGLHKTNRIHSSFLLHSFL